MTTNASKTIVAFRVIHRMGPGALLLLATSLRATASVLVSPSDVAAQYSLSTSTTLPFPTSTLASPDTLSFIMSQWSLSNDHISNGAADISFVDDPFPNDPTPGSIGNTSSPGPVLQTTYPSGSYSQGTGGAQWYSLWNPPHGSGFDSMLLSYEVAFDSNFQWVQGGKLPGLRGGPDNDGCSGGSQPIGNDCFSTRLMWRKGGAGEGKYIQLHLQSTRVHANSLCLHAYAGRSVFRKQHYL